MTINRRKFWSVPVILVVALLVMGSTFQAQADERPYEPPATSWVDAGWSIIPGLVEAPFPVRGMVPAKMKVAGLENFKPAPYDPPATSWVDAGWSTIPGLVEAPFTVRGMPPAPPSQRRVVRK